MLSAVAANGRRWINRLTDPAFVVPMLFWCACRPLHVSRQISLVSAKQPPAVGETWGGGRHALLQQPWAVGAAVAALPESAQAAICA